jgi:hypothetical protein
MLLSFPISLNRIYLLQKKAVRIITKSNHSNHTLPFCLANRISPFDELILLGKLLFMHSMAFNYALPSLTGVWCKNDDSDVGYQLCNTVDIV